MTNTQKGKGVKVPALYEHHTAADVDLQYHKYHHIVECGLKVKDKCLIQGQLSHNLLVTVCLLY